MFAFVAECDAGLAIIYVILTKSVPTMSFKDLEFAGDPGLEQPV